MVEAAVIFGIIITTQSGDGHAITFGRHYGCPTHPGEGDVRPELRRNASQLPGRPEIHPATEGMLTQLRIELPQARPPRRVLTNGQVLMHAGPCQRRCESFEKCFRPSIMSAGHDLEQAQRSWIHGWHSHGRLLYGARKPR